MDKLTILRDDLRLLKALLDTSKVISKNKSIKDIFYHPVWIADRIASFEGEVNYADLIGAIDDLVTYELEQTEKEIYEQKRSA